MIASRSWIRASISTLVFIVLLALTEFIQYGDALFTLRGVAGLVVKTALFFILMVIVIRADLSDLETTHTDD